MSEPAESRVGFVTGGSGGIGAATAEALVGRGPVAVGYRSGADEAKAVVAAVERAGGRAMAVAVDVTDLASVDAAVTEVEGSLGPVTALVNNAGVLGLQVGDHVGVLLVPQPLVRVEEPSPWCSRRTGRRSATGGCGAPAGGGLGGLVDETRFGHDGRA